VGGALALEVPIVGWLAARATWDAGAELVPIDGHVRARLGVRALLGIGLRR
jgi:hypothetical protein